MKKRKILAFILFSFLLFPGTGFSQYDYNSKEFQAIISQLDMQGHAKDDYATCSVKQMYYEEVAEMLNDEMNEEEIIQYYVDQYGQAALLEPALDVNGWIAWGMPAAGLIAGGIIVTQWLKKLKDKNKAELPMQIHWQSQTEKEITEKLFDEERHRHF